MIRYLKNRFSLIHCLLITCLLVFCLPMIRALNVNTVSQKEELLNMISRSLEVTAIEQARIVDPNYNWITYEEELSPEIQNALKENALTSQNVSSNSLTNDQNLIWIVDYNGKQFRHNWVEGYSEESSMIDVTYSADGEKVVLSGSSSLPNFSLFNQLTRGIVNPNLVSDDLAESNEFLYSIVLPEGFSIRFMIPPELTPDGGTIARYASYFDVDRYALFMAFSAALTGLFVLFWNMNAEKKSKVFAGLIRIKALFVFLLFILGFVMLTSGVTFLSRGLSSGELAEIFRSMGFSGMQSRAIATMLGFMIWWIWIYFIDLIILYFKYIFVCGLRRYLKEDTLTSAMVRKLENRVNTAASKPLERWLNRNVLLYYGTGAVFVLVSIMLAYGFFGTGFALTLLAAELIVVGVVVYRLFYLLRKDYETTLAAANELIAGNFSYLKPHSTGSFQSLYDSLIDVKDEFQTALKDGLHSQNMKTQLISNVSHDLKTPVTGIKSYAELISMSDNIEDIRNYATHLNGYTDRLSSLITDLFDVARASSGDIQLSISEIDLSQLIEQVAGEWQETFQKKKMQIMLTLDEKAPVRVDPDKTVRIFDNLFSNISKYGMEKTRIFVSLKADPEQIRVSIKNISKTPLDFSPEEITERFVRGDKSRHQPGAGLGLAIVKSFVEVQNGSFSIDIDGDVFTAVIQFPTAKPEIRLTETLTESAGLPAASLSSDLSSDSHVPNVLPENPESAADSAGLSGINAEEKQNSEKDHHDEDHPDIDPTVSMMIG